MAQRFKMRIVMTVERYMDVEVEAESIAEATDKAQMLDANGEIDWGEAEEDIVNVDVGEVFDEHEQTNPKSYIRTVAEFQDAIASFPLDMNVCGYDGGDSATAWDIIFVSIDAANGGEYVPSERYSEDVCEFVACLVVCEPEDESPMMTVRMLLDRLAKFESSELDIYVRNLQDKKFRRFSVEEGEVDGGLWVDTQCDGEHSGEETNVVQIAFS